jgi:hypothetical protein
MGVSGQHHAPAEPDNIINNYFGQDILNTYRCSQGEGTRALNESGVGPTRLSHNQFQVQLMYTRNP